jgi:hypothetical protein
MSFLHGKSDLEEALAAVAVKAGDRGGRHPAAHLARQPQPLRRQREAGA